MSHAGAGPSDPYFNPPFVNDVQFKDRGFLNNIIHFTKKHMDENLVSAAKNHIMAHLEFGSCLADYPGLNNRYNRIRQLEDVDIWKGRDNPGYVEPTRVRFVNYFTISTGRIPKPKSPSLSPDPSLRPEASTTTTTLTSTNTNTTPASQPHSDVKSGPPTPRISIEDHSDGTRPEILQLIDAVPEEGEDEPPAYTLQHPAPAAATNTTTSASDTPTSPPSTDPLPELNLPPIPSPPQPPVPLDLSQYPDPTIRKQAEKESKRAQKAYDQAVKSRDKILSERTKLIEKAKAKAAKEAAKSAKDKAKDQAKKDKEDQKRKAEESKRLAKLGPEVEEKKKERKFCMLPRKTNGERDSAWVQIYMEGVDEVGAHCGLFFPGPHYEKLIGEVGGRIVGWVQEDASRRAILDLEGGMEAIEMVDLD